MKSPEKTAAQSKPQGAHRHSCIEHMEIYRPTSTSTILCFDLKDASVKMKWTAYARSADGPTHKGELTIQGRANSEVTLSLYNLGLQGRRWSVLLAKSSSYTVHHCVENKDGECEREIVDDDGDGWIKIPKTGVVDGGDGKRNPADPKNVCFIRFTPKAEEEMVSFKVKSKRLRHFYNGPHISEGHDTAPPPPEPGGEEGDGED